MVALPAGCSALLWGSRTRTGRPLRPCRLRPGATWPMQDALEGNRRSGRIRGPQPMHQRFAHPRRGYGADGAARVIASIPAGPVLPVL